MLVLKGQHSEDLNPTSTDKSRYKLRLVHEALAIKLGSSRVVISRLLKELEQKGTISLYRGKIKIL